MNAGRGLSRAKWRPAILVGLMMAAGCGSPSPTPSVPPAAKAPPTFASDVAPILAAHCASCHRPGQGAPFNLLTYADAKPRAAAIADVTGRHVMPPWLPEPGEPSFVGERRLRPEDIDTLRRWADTGASQGPPLPAPTPLPADTWASGRPDLVLQPARAFPLTPGEDDVFRNLVIRTSLPADRFIRAVEFRPGDAPVHHAVLHLDRTTGSRRLDGGDGRPGFDGMGAMGTQEPDGHFIGWAPGRGPIVSAEGRPWRLARGTDLVLELHLIPQQAPVAVQPAVALFFSDTAASDAPLMFKMGSKAIDIPAGATNYAISDSYVLPADVTVLSVYPHAHYLGKDMQVHAMLPNGTSRPLLHIARWSFHWQQDYRFTTPIALPRGTTIAMRFTYDNSEANKDNPSHPPVRVMAGPRSTDEMGNLLLQLVPASAADRAKLQADAQAREAVANVAAAELMARAHPASAENLTFLGASYVDVGRLPEGISALSKAVALSPDSSKARNELAGGLLKAGRVEEAVREFQHAARLAPSDAYIHFNLGKALVAANAPDAARSALVRAVTLNPDFPEAHNELGVWLFARGRVAEALVHLRKAAALAPDSAIAHSDLGGALAQAGKRDEALVHIRKALLLDPGNTAARENLARLERGK